MLVAPEGLEEPRRAAGATSTYGYRLFSFGVNCFPVPIPIADTMSQASFIRRSLGACPDQYAYAGGELWRLQRLWHACMCLWYADSDLTGQSSLYHLLQAREVRSPPCKDKLEVGNIQFIGFGRR